MDEAKLIFIISQPRAGSTLTQKLLSNNSLVDTVSEPWILLPFLSIYKPGIVNSVYDYPMSVKAFFDYLKKRGNEAEFRNDYKKFVLSLYKMDHSSRYFIDKTPRYYEILPEIISFFPGARFLILKRNPFAALNSMLFTWTGGKIKNDVLKLFYRDFLVAPFLIQEFIETNCPGGNIFEVKYEEIVSAPESSVKGIYDWLGIPFSKSVLNIGENEKVKGLFGDDKVHKESPKEIKALRSVSWRQNFSDRELRDFFSGYQKFLSEGFLNRYGYAAEKFQTGLPGFGRNKFGVFISLLKKNNIPLPFGVH